MFLVKHFQWVVALQVWSVASQVWSVKSEEWSFGALRADLYITLRITVTSFSDIYHFSDNR